jgi:glycosyltransferase involved in cell wall biosynthesis
MNQDPPVINVLTRTSGRPNFFRENVESVQGQTYPHINHIVCADDDESYEYATKLCSNVIKVERKPKRTEYDWMHSPYNLYCNTMMDRVKEGWVMFLDDDDIFINQDSVRKIVKHIKSDDDFLIWRGQFPRAIIPGPYFGKGIVMGDIGSFNYMFHSKHIWAAQWDEVKESDYRVAMKMSRLLKTKWIDEVLVKINNTKVFHGPGGGLGRREDK